MTLGQHAGFILSAYGITAVVIGGLALWLAMEGRRHGRRLAELEARGLRRRSAVSGDT